MLKIIVLAMLALSASEAFADGRCSTTFNQATRAFEKRCEGNTPVNSILSEGEKKALQEGRARECVTEIHVEPMTSVFETPKAKVSRFCR